MATDPQLHRLHNDQFEVVFAAAMGRIVRYGQVGGPNVLWENPRAESTPSVFPGWLNWGGDKVWIWPESDWIPWLGAHVPPGDPASAPHEVRTDGLTMTAISPVIAGYGVRIVREITLRGSGSRVRIVNRLEKMAEGTQTLPVGVWMVTQVPAAERVRASLAEDAAPPGHASFAGGDWSGGIDVDNGVVTLTRAARPWAKIGLDADILTVRIGATQLFVADTNDPHNAAGPFEPFRRAQVFSDPDDSPFRPAELPPYLEFEFTSPVKSLAVGQSVELTVNWSIGSKAPR